VALNKNVFNIKEV